MKWYYWLLILLGILLYEIIRRQSFSFFSKLRLLILNTMRKTVRWLVTTLMRALRCIYEKLRLEAAVKGNYGTLTPTVNADPDGVYEQLLQENLSKSDVMNIALTGPYGSGKSSIIRTFIHRHPEYHYLNISLAAITEAAEGMAAEKMDFTGDNGGQHKPGGQPTNKGNANRKDAGKSEAIPGWTTRMSQQIEYSILQQMFYYVTGRQIPFSRFKRIRATSRLLLLITTTGICLLALSLWFLFFDGQHASLPDEWRSWVTKNKGDVQALSWLVLACGIFIIVYSLLRLYQHTQLIKLNLNSAQLEISPNKDASALNKHLDEILYFFSVIPIDIVVIEDLDRFRNPEIFIKLREINTLINNSRAIKRKITFLYALRDDVFTDEHRTKFFDFIAPVIPETNASNAASKLQEEIGKMKLPRSIPEQFLNDLGFFIQETRLLYNITNEFRIYQAQLKNFEVNYTHLLAIIVYKNKYPTDFSELQYNRGMIYANFSNRTIYIEKILEKHKDKRKHLNAQLDAIKHNHLKCKEELRIVYLGVLFKEIFKGITNYGFNGKIVVGYSELDLQELAQDNNFNTLKNSSPIHYKGINGHQLIFRGKFSDIERLVDEQPYDRRVEKVDEIFNQDREILEKELEKVNKKISEIRHYTMREIMSQPEIQEVETPIDGHPLLVYLISYGYLNETYSYYLSQFTEGEISKSDFDFLWAVKHRKQLAWEHHLEKLPTLIKKLRSKEFSYPEILNFDMAAYLVSNPHVYAEMLEQLMNQLKQLDNKSSLFIDHYIERRQEVPKFIRVLCKHVAGLWSFIELKSNYTAEKKNQYLRLIIEHADIDDIIRQNDNQLLSHYISQQAFLLSPVAEGLDPVKLQKVCTALEIQFDLPKGDVQPEQEMLRYVYEHNRYVLNQRMLSLVLKNLLHDYDETTFHPAQYTRILQSDLQTLRAYIDQNFEHYISSIFLEIEGHTQEAEASVLKVLNSEDIQMDTKKRVISEIDFKQEDINACNDKQLWSLLLEHARVKATWANVLSYYTTPLNEDEEPAGLTSALVHFLNMPDCANELSGQKIIPGENNGDMVDILIQICISGLLTDESLSYCLQAMGFTISKLDFSHIGEQHARILLQHGKVTFEVSSLNSLKQYHPALATEWIAANWGAFTALFSELQLTTSDWVNLLGDSRLNSNAEQKKFLLERLPDQQIVVVLEKGIAIPDKMLAEKKIAADYETLERMSCNPLVNKDSVGLILAGNMNGLVETQAKNILLNIGGEFAALAREEHPRVQKSEVMENLLVSLNANSFFIASFDIKNKYIHVTSILADDQS